MVSKTRNTIMTDSTFKNIIFNLLKQDKTSPIFLALTENGIITAYDIASMGNDTIDGITYQIMDDKTGTKEEKFLPVFAKQLVQIAGVLFVKNFVKLETLLMTRF